MVHSQAHRRTNLYTSSQVCCDAALPLACWLAFYRLFVCHLKPALLPPALVSPSCNTPPIRCCTTVHSNPFLIDTLWEEARVAHDCTLLTIRTHWYAFLNKTHISVHFSCVFLVAVKLSGARNCLKGKSLVAQQRAASLLVRNPEEGQAWDQLSPFFPTSAPSVFSTE